MTIDEIIKQLEDHLLKALDENGSPMMACNACMDDGDDAMDQCADDDIEAINQALIVLRRSKEGGA